MKLREFRKKNNLTQADAGMIIGKTGTGYGHYETGKSEPDIYSLIKLADYYKITLDELVGHEVPYLIDKSLLSEKQLNVINLIQKLNDYQCDRVESFIMGLSMAELERKQTIEKFNKREE